MAALAAVLAVIVIVSFFGTFGPALPQWIDNIIAKFSVWFAFGLAFAAYHGAKQYVQRKYSDISELPPILLGRFTRGSRDSG